MMNKKTLQSKLANYVQKCWRITNISAKTYTQTRKNARLFEYCLRVTTVRLRADQIVDIILCQSHAKTITAKFKYAAVPAPLSTRNNRYFSMARALFSSSDWLCRKKRYAQKNGKAHKEKKTKEKWGIASKSKPKKICLHRMATLYPRFAFIFSRNRHSFTFFSFSLNVFCSFACVDYYLFR